MERKLWGLSLLDVLARVRADGGDDDDEIVENEGGALNLRNLILTDWSVYLTVSPYHS